MKLTFGNVLGSTVALLAAAFLLSEHSSLAVDNFRFFRITGPAATGFTASKADGTLTWTSAVLNVTCTVQSSSTLLGGTNWQDYLQVPVNSLNVTNRLFDPNPPTGMSLIPTGPFTMGDSLDGVATSLPLRYVHVSAFYMDKYLVTKPVWDGVYTWAIAHGYVFDSYDGGAKGKANNHPVYNVSWYDCLKWCNARSEKEGRLPAYFTDVALGAKLKGGLGEGHVYVNWNNGYRLPTEAEWEKAARGGVAGQRFPWGSTISQNEANNYAYPLGSGGWAFDGNTTQGYHPAFNDGVTPYTSPVGYFSPNGYGLYDMIGNLWEWCWDAFSATYYSTSPGVDPVDPRGPEDLYPGSYPGTGPVMRGGAWPENAYNSRTASRNRSGANSGSVGIGFRTVLPGGQ